MLDGLAYNEINQSCYALIAYYDFANRRLISRMTAVLTHVRLNHSATRFPDDNRALEPPDPIPNSVVKRCIADGSVALRHVRVGHCQVLFLKNPNLYWLGFFYGWEYSLVDIFLSVTRNGFIPITA